VWQHFIWVHNAIWVEYLLDAAHVVDHGNAFGVIKEAGFLETDSMLCAYTSACIFDKVHYEWLDYVVQFLLKWLVFVAWDCNMQMEVAVSYVAKSCS